MYNSQYNVKVELRETQRRDSKQNWYGEVTFITELCENVDRQTYTKCLLDQSNIMYTERTKVVEDNEEQGQNEIRSRTVNL